MREAPKHYEPLLSSATRGHLIALARMGLELTGIVFVALLLLWGVLALI